MDPTKTTWRPGDELSADWCNEVNRLLGDVTAPDDNANQGGPRDWTLVPELPGNPLGEPAKPARMIPVWTRQTGAEASLFFVGTNPVYGDYGPVGSASGITISDEGWAKADILPGQAWLVVKDGQWDIKKDRPASSGGDGEKTFVLQIHDGKRQMCFSPVYVPPDEEEEEDGDGEDPEDPYDPNNPGGGGGYPKPPPPPPCGHPGNDLDSPDHPNDENDGHEDVEDDHPGVSPPSTDEGCPPTETTPTTPEPIQPSDPNPPSGPDPIPDPVTPPGPDPNPYPGPDILPPIIENPQPGDPGGPIILPY